MKPTKNSICILLIFFSAIYGCQKRTASLTDAEKDVITKEISETFSLMKDAMNSHDIDGLKKFFSNTNDYVFTSGVNVFTNVNDHFELVLMTHTNPDLLPFVIDINDIRIRVLSPEYAIVSATGSVNSSIGTDHESFLSLALTNFMKKTEGKWQVIAGHESSKPQ